MKIFELKNKLGELIIPKKWEPVGTIKMFDREQDMSKMYYGTWELTLKERSPIGINPSSSDSRFKLAGQQFGEKEHTLTIAELAEHDHYGPDGKSFALYSDANIQAYGSGNQSGFPISIATSTNLAGGGQAHNNIHPVETVYFYKRIA